MTCLDVFSIKLDNLTPNFAAMTRAPIAFNLTEQKLLRQPFILWHINILQAGCLEIDLKTKSNVLDYGCALHTCSAPSRRHS